MANFAWLSSSKLATSCQAQQRAMELWMFEFWHLDVFEILLQLRQLEWNFGKCLLLEERCSFVQHEVNRTVSESSHWPLCNVVLQRNQIVH
jgi:hypothetical protein